VGVQDMEIVPPVELQPRNTPVQERAKLTLQKILDATAELLDNEGHENLTTNRVAERSGVNIATIYHYFPNKEALLHALAQQFAEQQQEQLDAIYARRAETDWRDTVDKLNDAVFEFNRTVKGAAAVSRAMQSNATLRQIDYERDARQSEFIATLLAELGIKGSATELQTKALVLLQIGTAVVDHALMWYPEMAAALADELKRMQKQYIAYYIEQSAEDSSFGDTAD